MEIINFAITNWPLVLVVLIIIFAIIYSVFTGKKTVEKNRDVKMKYGSLIGCNCLVRQGEFELFSEDKNLIEGCNVFYLMAEDTDKVDFLPIRVIDVGYDKGIKTGVRAYFDFRINEIFEFEIRSIEQGKALLFSECLGCLAIDSSRVVGFKQGSKVNMRFNAFLYFGAFHKFEFSLVY